MHQIIEDEKRNVPPTKKELEKINRIVEVNKKRSEMTSRRLQMIKLVNGVRKKKITPNDIITNFF
jgi:hypothetical protein